VSDETKARDLLTRLLAFTEYVCDILNEMDAVEDEDLEKEGGILADVRAFLAPTPPEPPREDR
jgi:hypothetical protein